MRKYEIALMLAKRFGYTSYLEICTPLTGLTFSMVDKEQFSRRARLMYRCPGGFSDGEPIEFSTEADSAEELFSELMKSGERFDLVFIDPWHTYTSSLRDIVFGLRLIKEQGVVLLHDCSPPDAACAEPEPRPGEWSGVTFAAYLDVVLNSASIHYITIDSDYGCGIISKESMLDRPSDPYPDTELVSRWRSLNLSQRYSFLDENRTQLLRLISIEEFLTRVSRESHVEGTKGESSCQ